MDIAIRQIQALEKKVEELEGIIKTSTIHWPDLSEDQAELVNKILNSKEAGK